MMERERQVREAEERKATRSDALSVRLEDLQHSRLKNRRAVEYEQLHRESLKLLSALRMEPVEENIEELLDSSLTSDALLSKRVEVSNLRQRLMESKYSLANQVN